MLATDAYAFLDVDDPFCAWATYRGALVCAPDDPGFISVWAAGLMRSADAGRVSFEIALEEVRAIDFPYRVSRLRGMFCLMDEESVKRACSWNRNDRTHFQPEFLAELSLAEAGARRDQLDANWITNAPVDPTGQLTDRSWIASYWAGDPYPNVEPIWETIVDGRLIVLGTDLRQRAYKAVRSEFPDSLMLLEISRQAAWIGSDLGAISTFYKIEDGEVSVRYAMNMKDADNPEFLKKLTMLANSGHPINWADMKPHVDQGSFGSAPDLRPYGFRRAFRVGIDKSDTEE